MGRGEEEAVVQSACTSHDGGDGACLPSRQEREGVPYLLALLPKAIPDVFYFFFFFLSPFPT